MTESVAERYVRLGLQLGRTSAEGSRFIVCFEDRQRAAGTGRYVSPSTKRSDAAIRLAVTGDSLIAPGQHDVSCGNTRQAVVRTQPELRTCGT